MNEPQFPVVYEARIERALAFANDYGDTDGDWHKAWVIDQMVRALCGSEVAYQRWVAKHKDGKDGPETYGWSEGIAP